MILMSVKQQIPSVQFNNDTSDRPNITDLVPSTALKQNLRGSILTGVNDRTVMLVLLCGASEVDYLQFSLQRVVVLVYSLIAFSDLKVIPR